MELQHTIAHLRVYDQEIGEIESEIEKIMDDVNSPITSVPGIGMQMGRLFLRKSVVSADLTPLIRFWPMRACHLQRISPVN